MRSTLDHILFYADNITDNQTIFDESDSRHIISSLRLSVGDYINVTDGKGKIALFEISEVVKKRVVGKFKKNIEQRVRPRKIRLLVGIPEKDSFERMIPLLVPQGVSEIVPVECEHCQKRWWDRKWEKDYERFMRILITSAKQSWNSNFPTISKPVTFSVAVESARNIIYADIKGDKDKGLNMESGVDCFVGPPGGFSEGEIEKLASKGVGVNLGEFRLRTELAASLMVSKIN